MLTDKDQPSSDPANTGPDAKQPFPFHREKQRALSGFMKVPLIIFSLACMLPLAGKSEAITLSKNEAAAIGKKIWRNECNGTVSGLTSWNEGENFASLGIGHFIWYPRGQKGPFDESFPKLIAFLVAHGAGVPEWLRQAAHSDCPWNSRKEFLQAQDSPRMKELRQFLAETVDLQSQFLVDRLERSLPKMLAEAAPAERARVEQNFRRLSETSRGCYALIDYVNFKGEGVLHSERYQGQGWGLLQVLEEMRSGKYDPVEEFSRSAALVLRRRVQNAPPERHESRWLTGWLNRVNGYTRD
jgi:hypothetical protein